MKPPSKNLTSRDIARLAGVSQTTVSRVLQDSSLVQPETRKAVLDIIAQLRYAPSPAARSMRTRRSNTVALVVANLSANPLYPALLQMLSAALRKNGLHASVWEAEDFSEETMRTLAESAVDGVIVATAVDAALPFLFQIAERKPLILINRTVASDAFDQISSDNMGGGSAVAAYFDTHGRRGIGLISAQTLPSPIRDREAGFMAELVRRGIRMHSQAVARVPHFSYRTGFEAAQQILRPGGVDSIFCVNDIMAIGALDGARALGLAIPNDVWLVGYDDIPMASWDCVDLTTVHQPLDAMVDAAVARLCARLLSNAIAPERIVLPHSFVFRGSTG